jgi:hypothetical protein
MSTEYEVIYNVQESENIQYEICIEYETSSLEELISEIKSLTTKQSLSRLEYLVNRPVSLDSEIEAIYVGIIDIGIDVDDRDITDQVLGV